MAIDRQGISTGKTVRELTEELENELLLNFRKQFVAKHDKPIENVDWQSWQASQMMKFEKFKRDNVKIINKYQKKIAKEAVKDFEQSYRFGVKIVDGQIKRAKKKGLKLNVKNQVPIFTKNGRVINELQKMQEILNKSYTTAVKSLETQFLQTVSRARYAPRMAKSLFQAIDMANKELIRHGITGTITSNNRRINIANQIEMTVVETSQEVLFIGEAAKSDDAGLFYVYISQHRSSCPLCTPWQGRVLIDDVYQNGKPDGKHELLSTAIKKGLFH